MINRSSFSSLMSKGDKNMYGNKKKKKEEKKPTRTASKPKRKPKRKTAYG